MTDILDPETRIRTPRRATGRPVGSVHSAYLVLESMWTWYRGNWKATVFSSVGLPVLYLLAMGLGFGSQVRAGAVPGGVAYVVYLAPALFPAGAVQTAAGECTFPVLSGFAWSKRYIGVTASPITPSEIVFGELLWVTSRLIVSGVAFLLVALAVGAVSGRGILLSLVFGVCTGLAFGAPLIALAASVGGDGRAFNAVFRFVVVPMSLFAGTFFPITQLPAWVRPVAWITPMWHGTELARGAAFGTLSWGSALVHLGCLALMFTAGLLLARWRFRVRLTS
ncbi:MAG TPA: ABC transporter permease [Pseudonocardiaceae bacterium]|jgi:lipooligosaccharide transport system permease protein|nr:ABC transporter permease [Pseudonocardiaceae bacterium]